MKYHLFLLKQWLLLLRTDFVVVSYPKTGGTWLQLLIRTLLIRHFNLGENEINALFDNSLRGLCRIKKLFPKIYVTHAMPGFNNEPYHSMTVDNLKFKRQKVILLVREPKDTLVSLYFHNRHRTVPPAYISDIDSMVHDKIYGINKFIGYYQAWYQDKEKMKDFLLMRYEDLRINTKAQLKLLCHFLAFPEVSDETIEYAINFCSFTNMKKAEAENSTLPGLNRSKNISPEAFKVREGMIEGYKKYLRNETICYIDNCILKKLPTIYGYPLKQEHGQTNNASQIKK